APTRAKLSLSFWGSTHITFHVASPFREVCPVREAGEPRGTCVVDGPYRHKSASVAAASRSVHDRRAPHPPPARMHRNQSVIDRKNSRETPRHPRPKCEHSNGVTFHVSRAQNH